MKKLFIIFFIAFSFAPVAYAETYTPIPAGYSNLNLGQTSAIQQQGTQVGANGNVPVNGCNPTTGQCTYAPLEPLPTNNPYLVNGNYASLGDYFSVIFPLLIGFSGLFAVVMLVIAGIGYMVAESMVDIDKAKSRGKSALWGMLLIGMSWLILYTINPQLLNFSLLKTDLATNFPSNSGGTVQQYNPQTDQWANYNQYRDQIQQNITSSHSAQDCSTAVRWLKDNGAYSPNASGMLTNQMSQLGCGTVASRTQNGNSAQCSQLYQQMMTYWSTAFSNSCAGQ